MKKINFFGSRAFSLVAALLVSLSAFAQDKKLDVDINVNKGGQWYSQPWVWVVGGLVFILLLVAILRGGKKA